MVGIDDSSLYSEYQPKGGDALRLGSKGRYGSYVGGRRSLCDPLVTHGPYLSALKIKGLYCINLSVFYLSDEPDELPK